MEEEIQVYIQTLAEHTLKLVAQPPEPGYPQGAASGFIWYDGEKHILIAAGHSFRETERWYIETDVVIDRKTLLIPLESVTTIAQVHIDTNEIVDLDIAWASVTHVERNPLATDDVRSKPELPVYRGPIEAPRAGEYYGFAAYSRVSVDANLDVAIREPCFEIGMRYVGKDSDGLYRFSLAREHQGSGYYKGVSGAPIADRAGRIVSIVISGNPAANEVLGAPLIAYVPLFRLRTAEE